LLAELGQASEPIDYHILLLSLPYRLGTTLATIPADVPYLEPPGGFIARWRQRLSGLGGKKIGLAWSGDEAYLSHRFRNMSLRQFLPLLDLPGISWVSLQKGGARGEIEAAGWSGKILDPMDEVVDFAGTAAIIANLDLVLAVDTSVAHLAGAMGVPVWLMNRFDTDWRWLTDRSDSPWYPTMRIFRQTSSGDWDSVMPRVAEALAAWVTEGGGNPARTLATPEVLAASPAAPALKLNLGCGNRKMKGFVNVDRVAACQPDRVVDLEQTPWLWADDSVDEIKLIHVLEHLGQRTEVFLSIIKEMYRVCRNRARIEIIVPHPRHDNFLGDPTHVRPVTGQMLSLFSQRLNREWSKLGAANTPLGLIIGVDFEIESNVYTLDSVWQARLSSGELNEVEIDQAARQYNNVISQSTIVWRVRKPA
jgi:hypothetical protein